MISQHADFVELVQTLRSLGAVRVRDGSLEVAFAAPPAASATPTDSLRVSDTDLEELAVLRRYSEEIP